MSTLFPMPKLGLDMTSGVIVHWLVQEGAQVQAGQPVLEIETDKAAQELASPVGGTLARILKQEGEDVPCGEPMAVILAPGETLSVAADLPFSAALAAAPASNPMPRQASPAADPQPGGRIFISPVAKRRLRELGLDLEAVTPRAGKIGLEEVEAAHRRKTTGSGQVVPSSPSAPSISFAGNQPMSVTRRRIAEHMSLSARTVARVGLTLEADASNLVSLREKFSVGEKKISYNVLLASLVARGLCEFPYMNTQLDGEQIRTLPEVNIGIAVDTPKGLMVPVLHQVDRKDIPTLQSEFDALSGRAQAGTIQVEDLHGGTFTITNLGSLEIETFLPVINVPECAILGVGAILKKPVVVEDKVVIRPRLGLTLAFDHRLVDGVPAGRFLQRIKQLIETAGKN